MSPRDGPTATWSHRIRVWFVLAGSALLFAGVAGHAVFTAGYPLQVDTAWGPRAAPVPSGFYAPIGLLSRFAVGVAGGDVAGKAYVLGLLVLCAAAPMVALRKQPLWTRLLAGAIGVFNPWVYERIVEGQWTVAAAGASLFLFLAATDFLDERPSGAAAVLVVLSTALVLMLSPVFVSMLAILAGARVMFGDRAQPAEEEEIRSARRRWGLRALAGAGVLLVVGALSFGLGHGQGSYQRVRTFGRLDLDFFRAHGSPFGLPVRIAGLSGFWAERVGRFETLDAGRAWWPIASLGLVALALVGAWRIRSRRWLLYAGLTGLVLSASTAIAPVRAAVGDVGRHLPFLFSFREPEKFSALWLLAVVVLTGELLGSLAASERARGTPWRTPIVVAGVIATMLLLGVAREPALLSRTLRPVSYPTDWYDAARYLRQHPTDGKTAVLPWHHYLSLPLAGGRVVQNPADVFFPGRLLVPLEPEIGPGADDEYADIARGETGSSTPCALARALGAHDVGAVVVLPVLEGPADVAGLRACGFRLVRGDTTKVAILVPSRRLKSD